MELNNQELHFTGSISTSLWTLNRADSLIALAEKDAENAKTLAACATIILAVALEQGIQTMLSDSAVRAAVDENIQVSDTKAAPFHKTRNNVWYKLQILPGILTDDRFELDLDHRLTKLLKELINTRNKLVHVDEQAVLLDTRNDKDKIKVEDNQVTVTFSVPLPPWETVKLEKVKGFREAVAVYLREVLFPESGEIIEGTIVIPAS
jgi:septum formation topological specificity factor MinE